MKLPIVLITLIVIALITIGLGIYFLITQRKKKVTPNYRTLFIIGIIWLPAGFAIHNYALSAIGLVFLIISLLNRKKWKEEKKWSDLTLQEKKTKYILIGIATFLLIIGMIVIFLVK
jgi:hypothetical protein